MNKVITWFSDRLTGRIDSKTKLTDLLDSGRFRWRNLQSLADDAGISKEEAIPLLREIGARPQRGNPEKWGWADRERRLKNKAGSGPGRTAGPHAAAENDDEENIG